MRGLFCGFDWVEVAYVRTPREARGFCAFVASVRCANKAPRLVASLMIFRIYFDRECRTNVV